jgi:hypothetical protein
MKNLLLYLLIISVSTIVAALAGPNISELMMLSSQSEMITVRITVFFFTAVILRLLTFVLGR